MLLTLENQRLRIEVATLGAELSSIFDKTTGREYLWQGDPGVWARRSPLLFPNCGKFKDNHYFVGEKEYPGTQHGFARDMKHKLVCQDSTLICLRLEYSKETLERYPYQFAVKTTYALKDNQLACKFKVINYGSETMYFSFGFHTGFNCPFIPGTKSTDYSLELERPEVLTLLNTREGLLTRDTTMWNPHNGEVPIVDDIFTKSAILKEPSSRYIQLTHRDSGDFVRVHLKNAPYTVLWTVPKETAAVCIEPWHGLPDDENTQGNLETKEGIIALGEREEYVAQQVIEIGSTT